MFLAQVRSHVSVLVCYEKLFIHLKIVICKIAWIKQYFSHIFIHEVQSSGVRASIKIVHIQKFFFESDSYSEWLEGQFVREEFEANIGI